MSAPAGTDPRLAAYLQQLEDRLAALENPQSPLPVFAMASTNLTVANAKTYINCVVYATDLNILAHSNGAHWYREDSGVLII